MSENRQRRLETMLWIAAIFLLCVALLLIEPVRAQLLDWSGMLRSEPMTGFE